MDIFTVSFFGHREIENASEVEYRLENVIRDLIKHKEYVDFLVGREGEFDLLSASVIRRVAKAYDYGNSSLVLVLPYLKADYRDNEQNFREYYNEIEICSKSASSHFKAAIQIRNRYMVDRSDLVVCCIQRKSGGAYKTLMYAEKQGRKIINAAKEINQ